MKEIEYIREHVAADGAVWKVMDVRRWRDGLFEYFAKSGNKSAWILEGTFRPEKKLVVSESDIDMAISYLRSLPHMQSRRPVSWDRKSLLRSIRQEVGSRPKVGSCHIVGSAVYAIVGTTGLTSASEASLCDGKILVRLAITASSTINDLVEIP